MKWMGLDGVGLGGEMGYEMWENGWDGSDVGCGGNWEG